MRYKKILKGCGITVGVLVLILLVTIGVGAYYLLKVYIRECKEEEEEKEARMLSRCTEVRDITAELSRATGYANGHGYVNLGLSVKWATCNIGASSPEGYGNYYEWGAITPVQNSPRDNMLHNGLLDLDSLCISSDPRYDAARATWGGKWRLPTEEEMGELIGSCKHEIAMCRGQIGYIVTGPNGNSIFLPAAGGYESYKGEKRTNVGDTGIYWTGNSEYSTYTGSWDNGKLLFDALSFSISIWDDYYDGRVSVRPVTE